MKKIIKLTIIFCLLLNIFSLGLLAQAADGLLPDQESGTATRPSDYTGSNSGNYSLNDMTGVIIKVANLILGLVGSLALLAFVAGGLMMMLSAGNPEWVTRGKQTLIGATVGLAIVFTSYMIIQLVFTSLGISGSWYSSDWFK